ncbi:hypothetical protein BDA99DRAFT_541233 [Phascolomyces articulosus]|uniref:Transmembrane protein n=1 Tax=Phascolomyces articulosus TaxID=60185 RepID=A0AAD5K273_9FUNG|nr:hypothetical protein BDA99DRAFT_541233 [Phascolomyces articulosus]
MQQMQLYLFIGSRSNQMFILCMRLCISKTCVHLLAPQTFCSSSLCLSTTLLYIPKKKIIDKKIDHLQLPYNSIVKIVVIQGIPGCSGCKYAYLADIVILAWFPNIIISILMIIQQAFFDLDIIWLAKTYNNNVLLALSIWWLFRTSLSGKSILQVNLGGNGAYF